MLFRGKYFEHKHIVSIRLSCLNSVSTFRCLCPPDCSVWVQNRHTGELIIAGKTSHNQNYNKGLSCLRYHFPSMRLNTKYINSSRVISSTWRFDSARARWPSFCFRLFEFSQCCPMFVSSCLSCPACSGKLNCPAYVSSRLTCLGEFSELYVCVLSLRAVVSSLACMLVSCLRDEFTIIIVCRCCVCVLSRRAGDQTRTNTSRRKLCRSLPNLCSWHRLWLQSRLQ